MSENESVKRVARTVVLGIVGAALVMLLLTAIGDGRAPLAQGAAGQVGAAANVWASCTIANVAAYSTRIHVKCLPAVSSNIYYLAAPTTDAANAARLLSLMSTALVAGRPLDVLFNPDDTGNLPPGCGSGDCRLLLAASMD